MIHVVHLAFCRVEASIAAFERILPELRDKDYKFYCVDLGYPLNQGDELRRYFLQAPKATYMKLDNLGQSANTEMLLKILHCGKDEQVLFWDHDNNLEPLGWLTCMVQAMQADDCVGYVTCRLVNKPEYYDAQGEQVELNGHKARKLKWSGGWPIGLFRGSFRGITAQLPYYGETEAEILQALHKSSMYGIMLDSITDVQSIGSQDPEYTAWKQHVIGKKGQMSFKEYLNGKRLV